MASGIIQNKTSIKGSVSNKSANFSGQATVGGGSTDHNRLTNRDKEDQHIIESITGLREVLDALDSSKLDAETALPLIEEATQNKAKGLYFDAMKEFAKKSYWYLTAEIDPVTKLGTKTSIISGPYDLGMGGGSGGGGVTTITVKPHEWPSTIVVGAKTELAVNWSSTIGDDKSPTGTGTLYLTINSKQVEVRSNVEQGIVTFDVSKYIIAGTNTIQIKVLDMYGTTGIAVSTINAVTLELKSDFNADLSYSGTINYTYTPYGDVEKTVYFVVDGKTKGTQSVKSTGESQTFQLSNLGHGSHTLEVYFTAIVGSETVSSNSLFYDLIYYIPGNKTPIIASTFNTFEQEQFISFNIPYRVFIYDRNSFDVTLSVNGVLSQSLTVGTAVQSWNYKNDTPGNYILEIACGSTKKIFNIHINKSSVELTPITTDLALGLTTQGRSNAEPSDQRSTWRDEINDISCELSNFNWSSNGWVQDAEGNTVLRVSGDARIKIPYKVFEEDFKTRGKTIELEIATSAVRNYSSTIISCLDKSRTDFYVAEPSFVDDETRLMAFDVAVDTEKIKEIGLPLGDHVISYTANGWLYDKTIIDPAAWGLTIEEKLLNVEGEEGDAIRVGDNIKISYSLQARGFYVTPQIAAIRSQQSSLSTQYKEDEHVRLTFVIERNTANRIIWMYIDGVASGACQYPVDDSFRQLDPDIIEIGSNDVILDIYNIRVYDNSLNSRQVVNNWIADTQDASLRVQRYVRNNNYNDKNEIIISQLPADLPYIIWDIDPLPEYKGDKRMGNARYVDPANPERNWTAQVAEFNVQGTSSSVYPTKNIRLRMRSKNGAGYTWYNDDGDEISKFPITYPGGIGANYFTFKVDFASSESANNVELVRLYNEAAMAAGIFTPPQREELLKNGGDVSKVMTRVGIDGFPVVAFHQDKDGNVKFRTKANFNNDKANEDVYGFGDGDESWEIANNSAAEGKFQVPITVDNFENGLEIRFPDEDGYNDMSKLGPMSAWVASTYRAEATGEAFAEPITFEYEETTKAEDGTFSKVKVSKTFEADTEGYRLTKFKAELADWFNVDATIFYYIFTLLFLMIDSRAKNAFPTYFKSRTAGDGGDKWFWLPYDMDTALGIDNKGKLTFDYNLEDFDQLDGADVYNGQDSVIWTNLRDAFPGEIAEMYATLRTQRLLSYDNVERMFTEHQSKWTETIFNEDSAIKYITPLQDGDNYLEMLQGSKKQQRKWWLYNRFKYLDSKFNAGDAKADFIQFRAYVDAGVEKPNITITPYADIYATVSYANSATGTKAKRAKRNEPIIIENPFGINEKQNDQETYIYSASQLKSIGDISPFHPDTVKIGNAVKLQDLKVGDASPDYSNPYLKELTVGNNTLLRSMDVRNCVNLTQAIDISKCINIEEIYFSGTKITGITLPDGGNIKALHLPETLTKLTIKNQPLLKDLQLAGTSNIESLWLENIPSTSIDAKALVAQMKYNSAVRLIGINETYSKWEDIRDFYNLLDTMKGLDSEGLIVDKAQVTGTIKVKTVPYANYVELSAKYPEVKIEADQIICTVTFLNEIQEGVVVLHTKKETPINTSCEAPLPPTKEMTASHYFTFNGWKDENNEEWSTDTIITKDIIYSAEYIETIRTFTVRFETDSTVIVAEPSSTTVHYGETISEPTVVGVPPKVLLTGWYIGENLDILWNFEQSKVLQDETLVAHWVDTDAPSINNIVINNFNTFTIKATDNLGISAYALTSGPLQGEVVVPEIWEDLPETVETFEKQFTVNSSGSWYAWIKDRSGKSTYIKVISYPVVYEMTNGISYISVTNGENKVTNFALSGTELTYFAEVAEHFENLQLILNTVQIPIGSSWSIDSPVLVKAISTPKQYTVDFVTGFENEGIIEPSQTHICLEKLVHPAFRYHNGKIIEGWYLDLADINTRWDFEQQSIMANHTLYAKWTALNMPTKLTIQTSAINQIVKLSLTPKTINSAITIEWGDSTENTVYYATATNTIQVSHIYEQIGSYIISVSGNEFGYELGGNKNTLINPASCLLDVDFSWDVTLIREGAFKNTSLTHLKLTNYIRTIEAKAFEACLQLKTIDFVTGLIDLGNDAFRTCTELTDITLPESLLTIGDYALAGCSNLERVEFAPRAKLTRIGAYALQSCSKLSSIIIPETVKFIDKQALAFTGLTSVQLLNPELELGNYVFLGTTGLVSAGPLNEVDEYKQPYNIQFAWAEEIPDNAFSYSLPTMSGAVSFLKKVKLPVGLKRIGIQAFYNTQSLAELNLPITLLEIDRGAFAGSRISTLTIPAGVERIGNGICRGCKSLKSATILTSVNDWSDENTAPGDGWFFNCPALTGIYIPSEIFDAHTAAYGAYWDVYLEVSQTITTHTIIELG
jgi:hypothetical protein